MPCICYGAASGEEELDAFLLTKEGEKAMECLKEAAFLIKKNNVRLECWKGDFEKAFIQAFTHMLLGCNE